MSLAPGEVYSGGEVRDANGRMVVAVDSLSAFPLPASVSLVTTQLGSSSGTDDTATINTILAAGGRVRGKPGQTYLITAPLVIPSNTELDMTGCTVAYANTGVLTNMLQNKAVTPAVTATDVTTTSTSSTISSVTLAAVAAVGQTIAVAAAGSAGGDTGTGNGRIALYGTVLSVSAPNIVLTGNTNGVAAGASLSNATGYLFNRDSNITVIGGTWNAGTNWNLGTLALRENVNSHLLRFRRVDGLTVRDVTVKAVSYPGGGGGSYGIAPGDVTDFLITNITGVGAGAIVQGDGPLSRGIVMNVRGTTQDDMVAFGCVNFAGNDMEGDISDILVSNVESNNSWRALAFFSGVGGNSVQRILSNGTGRGIHGTCQTDVVRVVDYGGVGQISCFLDDVTAAPGSGVRLLNTATNTANQVNAGPELAYAQITASQGALGPSDTDVAGLTITFPAPLSGKVLITAWCSGVQQVTSTGFPEVKITDSSNVVKAYVGAGTLTAAAFGPGMIAMARISGLTPGTSYTYKVRASTTAGTTTFTAGATQPAYIQAVAL